MAARSRFDVALGRVRLRLRVAQRLVARTFSFLKRRRSRFDSAGRIGDMQSRMHLTHQARAAIHSVAWPDARLSFCPSAFSRRA
jgi:hypothetical protein